MTTLQKFITRLDYGFLFSLLIPILAILPLLLHAGLPNTADGPAHLMRQVELNQAWSEGLLYPRWGRDLAHGHGMPIFSYAPPFLYQLTQLFHISGFPLDESMKAVVMFDFLLYSVGMFLFMRRIYGLYPAWLAAALHVYAPYRLREAYIQGNYGQFSGLAFYPLIFWAFHGLLTEGKARYWLLAPLSLAGLLYSHNISTMLFIPMFGLYLLFLLAIQSYQSFEQAPTLAQFSSRFARLFWRPLWGGLLGLGLSAIFWLPAFGERHDIKLEGITQGFFDFRTNFISLDELLAAPNLLDLTAINPEFPLSLGVAQWFGALLGFVVVIWLMVLRLRGKGLAALGRDSALLHGLFFAVFTALYAYLALPYSQLLWENTPLLELAEFPWRMLGPAIFCASILGGVAFAWLLQPLYSQKMRLNLFTALFFGLVLLNGAYLYPSQFIQWGSPSPADAFAYEISSGAIGTTSTGEFLPRWAERNPGSQTLWPDYAANRSPQKLDPTTLPAQAQVRLERQGESDTFYINTPQAFRATIRSLYWPGWQVYLNGQPHPFEIAPETGLIETKIPAGAHQLVLRLENTPLRDWANRFSIISLLVWLIVPLAIWRYPAQQTSPKPQERISAKSFGQIVMALGAIWLVMLWIQPRFTLQSNPDAPIPAQQNLQVDFGETIRLVGVDDWPQSLALHSEQDRSLDLVLYWRALQDLAEDYSVFLHLDAPNGQTYATVDESNPADIPTRSWPPGLYLRNPLRLELPPDLPPIRYDLTTGMYHSNTAHRLIVDDRTGANQYTLGHIWLLPAESPQAGPVLAQFGPYISLHQAEVRDSALHVHWQTTQRLSEDYSIFVHVLDERGQLLSQADGVPYAGLYPPINWFPNQLIEDVRPLHLESQASHIAIGFYQPDGAFRLPAQTPQGHPLPDDRFIIALKP